MERGGKEQLSHCNWYKASEKPVSVHLLWQDGYDVPQYPAANWVPVRPQLPVRLDQMQDLQGEGSVTLDAFHDQVDELSWFYQWG